MIGCCFPHDLCSLHRAGLFAQLRGTAATRGEVWADELAKRRVLLEMPWPTGSEKMLAVARKKVADLARDPQLVEQLAAELARWAERRWRSIGAPS